MRVVRSALRAFIATLLLGGIGVIGDSVALVPILAVAAVFAALTAAVYAAQRHLPRPRPDVWTLEAWIDRHDSLLLDGVERPEAVARADSREEDQWAAAVEWEQMRATKAALAGRGVSSPSASVPPMYVSDPRGVVVLGHPPRMRTPPLLMRQGDSIVCWQGEFEDADALTFKWKTDACGYWTELVGATSVWISAASFPPGTAVRCFVTTTNAYGSCRASSDVFYV